MSAGSRGLGVVIVFEESFLLQVYMPEHAGPARKSSVRHQCLGLDSPELRKLEKTLRFFCKIRERATPKP